MGSTIGPLQSGDPEFPAGAPGALRRFLPSVVWSLLRGHRRSLARDAAAIGAYINPPPRIEGADLIPREGPFALVANHYQAPRMWIGWVVAAITDVVCRARGPAGGELHWLILAEWGRQTSGGRWISNPLTSVLFPRVAWMWGLVPTSQRPDDTAARARALRQVMAYVRGRSGADAAPPEPIGIMPEGTGTTALGEAMPGTGAFLHRLSGHGVPLLPVGIFQAEGTVVIRFGPPFRLGAAPTGTTDADTWARERLMAAIGRLLPRSLWGFYAGAVEREADGN